MAASKTPTPPAKLRDLAHQYADAGDLTPLEMLALGPKLREALHDYEDRLVEAARRDAIRWQEIADSLGMHRQNTQRRFKHVRDPWKRARRT